MKENKGRNRTVGSAVIATLILLTASPVALHAQFPAVRTAVPSLAAALSGAVRDEANKPVAATVTIATQGLRQSALTAADGSFAFTA